MAGATAKSDHNRDLPDRPEFAVVLGLLPPYSMEDVKRVYLDKVKEAHPDRGGDRIAFEKIQDAFEQAQKYLSFRSDRRQWIAARMEEYLAVVALVDSLRSMGAEVETDTHDWVRRSFGDFASMTETIIGIRLADSAHAPAALDALVREQGNLQTLKRLEFPGSSLDDEHVWQIRVFRQLTHLDLSRTRITAKSLALVDWLPGVTTWEVGGTAIGWWDRFQLNRTLKKRRDAMPDPVIHPVNIR